jgi:DNA-binding transcriptional regulator LsrR (DeoR family)
VSTPRDDQALADVARRYYLHGRSQQQVADELGISRSNVSRMLTSALERGIVEIRVHDPSGRDDELERALVARFGLRAARVAVWAGAGAAADRDDPLTRVGPLAAELLLETAVDGARLALSWGRALQAMVWAVASRREHAVEIVQLVGGLPSVEHEISGQELVRELATRLGAVRLHYLHAPAVLSSPAALAALLTESSVAQTLQAARDADVAFVGIGSPEQGSSARVLDAAVGGRGAARKEFWAARPVGDVALRYFDAVGRAIRGEVDAQVVGVTIEDLRSVPTVVGVAGGQAKVQAVLGAVRGRIVDVLVCDDGLARAVLEAADADGRTT